MPLPFYSTCVTWPDEKLAALEYLIENSDQISCDDLAAQVEAPEELPAPSDWHVTYWSLPGEPLVFFVHSAIEHVFADEETIDRLQDLALSEAA